MKLAKTIFSIMIFLLLTNHTYAQKGQARQYKGIEKEVVSAVLSTSKQIKQWEIWRANSYVTTIYQDKPNEQTQDFFLFSSAYQNLIKLRCIKGEYELSLIALEKLPSNATQMAEDLTHSISFLLNQIDEVIDFYHTPQQNKYTVRFTYASITYLSESHIIITLKSNISKGKNSSWRRLEVHIQKAQKGIEVTSKVKCPIVFKCTSSN